MNTEDTAKEFIKWASDTMQLSLSETQKELNKMNDTQIKSLIDAFKKANPEKKQQGGLLRFTSLPEKVYNEKGVFFGNYEDPKVIEKMGNMSNARKWTFVKPTIPAQINNTVNQSAMLWNPRTLPTTDVVVEAWQWPGKNDERPVAIRVEPSVMASNLVSLKRK